MIVLLVIAVLASIVFNLVMVTSLSREAENGGRAEPARQMDTAPAEASNAPDRAAVAPDPAGDAAPPAPRGLPSSDGDGGEHDGAG